jgi:HEAT repeat protein
MSESEQDELEDSFKSDPRSDEELISVALSYNADDDQYWDLVWMLHRRDTLELFGRAEGLAQSRQSAERRLGADILGQLGSPERKFPNECVAALLEMLKNEKDVEVLQAILIALGHLIDPQIIAPAAGFRRHPDPRVRHGVVQALMWYEDQLAVESLIELSRDVDTHNRDWATFALGSQISLDTSSIREALVARLHDADFDTRSEAIAGLAQRRDGRVIPFIIKELTSDSVGTLAVEAAAAIAAPELLPHLLPLRKWWDVCPTSLEEAIQACSGKPLAST